MACSPRSSGWRLSAHLTSHGHASSPMQVRAVLEGVLTRVERMVARSYRMANSERPERPLDSHERALNSDQAQQHWMEKLYQYVEGLGGSRSLVAGFSCRMEVRLAGNSAGTTDLYYYGKGGRPKFRSKAEVGRHLRLLGDGSGPRMTLAVSQRPPMHPIGTLPLHPSLVVAPAAPTASMAPAVHPILDTPLPPSSPVSRSTRYPLSTVYSSHHRHLHHHLRQYGILRGMQFSPLSSS